VLSDPSLSAFGSLTECFRIQSCSPDGAKRNASLGQDELAAPERPCKPRSSGRGKKSGPAANGSRRVSQRRREPDLAPPWPTACSRWLTRIRQQPARARLTPLYATASGRVTWLYATGRPCCHHCVLSRQIRAPNPPGTQPRTHDARRSLRLDLKALSAAAERASDLPHLSTGNAQREGTSDPSLSAFGSLTEWSAGAAAGGPRRLWQPPPSPAAPGRQAEQGPFVGHLFDWSCSIGCLLRTRPTSFQALAGPAGRSISLIEQDQIKSCSPLTVLPAEHSSSAHRRPPPSSPAAVLRAVRRPALPRPLSGDGIQGRTTSAIRISTVDARLVDRRCAKQRIV